MLTPALLGPYSRPCGRVFMDDASPSKKETRDAYAAAMALALARTRSKQRAEDFVQEAFKRLLTTRPWDRNRGPFERHVLGIVASLISNEYRGAATRNEAVAQQAFHDEVVGHHTTSAEEQVLEQADDKERQAGATREIEQLRASVAGDQVACDVLQWRGEGLHKAADIANALGVDIDQVYRSNELLRDRLKKIREAK